MRLDGRQKITRNQTRPLMDQLIKRMLPIGTCSTPDDLPRFIVYRLSITINRLAITLHETLLQKTSQLIHVLIIGEDTLRMSTKKIGIPYTNHAQQNRNIFIKWRLPKMHIHIMHPLEHLLKIFIPNRTSESQTDRARKRKTTTDPLPKSKHIIGIYTKLHHRLLIRTYRHKMLSDVIRILRRLHKPPTSSMRIRHRLLRGERLRCDHKQGALWLHFFEHLRDIATIHIGHKMCGQARSMKRRQSLRRKSHPQIRTTDPDIDDVRDRIALIPPPKATF